MSFGATASISNMCVCVRVYYECIRHVSFCIVSSAVGYLCIHVREKGRVRDIRISVQNVRETEWKEIKEEKK